VEGGVISISRSTTNLQQIPEKYTLFPGLFVGKTDQEEQDIFQY
jgi:hypothetical protein